MNNRVHNLTLFDCELLKIEIKIKTVDYIKRLMVLDLDNIKKIISTVKDNSCVNVETGRKIKWTNAKEKKMYFNKALQICCQKSVPEKKWKNIVSQLASPPKKTGKDPFDYFDWADDQSIAEEELFNPKGYMEYIKN